MSSACVFFVFLSVCYPQPTSSPIAMCHLDCQSTWQLSVKQQLTHMYDKWNHWPGKEMGCCEWPVNGWIKPGGGLLVDHFVFLESSRNDYTLYKLWGSHITLYRVSPRCPLFYAFNTHTLLQTLNKERVTHLPSAAIYFTCHLCAHSHSHTACVSTHTHGRSGCPKVIYNLIMCVCVCGSVCGEGTGNWNKGPLSWSYSFQPLWWQLGWRRGTA